ncbi:MAG: hypothetical protein U1F53_02035 [Burkholderiaceae bacterium]
MSTRHTTRSGAAPEGMNARRLALPAARACALAMALAVPAAEAARPLATEDAGVLAPHGCEWESVVIDASSRGAPAERAWSNQIACGVGAGTQLALAHAAPRADGRGEPAWLLGGKTELLAGDDAPVALTLAYGAGYVRPAGGRGYQPAGRSVALVGSFSPAEGWTAHANLGWARDAAADASGASWNLALEDALTATIDVGAEWFGAQHASPQWGLGLRYTPSEHWSFNLGRTASTDAGQARVWSAGLKFAF